MYEIDLDENAGRPVVLGTRYRHGGRRGRGLTKVQRLLSDAVDRKVGDGTYPLERVSCCICDETRFEPLSEQDRHGVRSSVVVCKTCGLVLTNPRPTPQAYAEYYANEYYQLEYGRDEPALDFFELQYKRGKEIFEYLQRTATLPLKGSRVLEIGCGSGGILLYFREKGFRVCGFDLSDSFTEFGRSQYGLELAKGTIADVPPDWAPDLVIYSHTFEHVVLPKDELRRIRTLLADTGALYVQVPGIKNLRLGYRLDFLSYLQFAHTFHFSLTSLTNLLQLNGFQRLAGDEHINAVFVKRRFDRVTPTSDYVAVMEYLRRAERKRFPLFLARLPMRLLDIALKKVRQSSSSRAD